ncbi:glycosyltransferase [Belliella kenyensis]|uniref:Glycosyltransferase n=1 Tax=Belliella kenyensis TaxID=1472724 RepID=A0ABV8EH80_9BACT|nr:glycosyltransferase [Belliella kenyensis]MCH7401708.1 glycosyltransferase [Belliella kenyensis]MDN3604208.1 glycosyltransferase [Belliella kenyensis]
MKVLTIISKLEMGGIEKTLLSCLPLLTKNGIEIHILCSLGGALDDEFRKSGAILIDFGNNKRPFFDALFLKKLLEENSFDIVHSRFGHTSGVFAWLCYKLKIPFLVSIHNEKAMFRNSWEGKFFLGELRKIYLLFHKTLTKRFASKIIGHSKTNLEYFIDEVEVNLGKGKYELIYNGVDFNKFKVLNELEPQKKSDLLSFIADSSKTLVHIGSFKEQKNHSFLIDVFNNLDPKINNYKLILLGEGSLLSVIKQKVASLKLDKNVFFVGMETNLVPFLEVSDVFFFPSLYEGFGNVLIEAQYFKLPICASNIKPHYEAVYEGYYPYFFDPNDIDEATNKLNKLLMIGKNNEHLNSAFLYSKEFSINNMVENLINLFNTVLEERSK